MTSLPTLQPILDDVAKRFEAQLLQVEIPRPNEVYLRVSMNSVASLSAYFYRKWNARLAIVFATDARSDNGSWFVWYVFAFDTAHGFFVLKAAVPTDAPEFPSLTNAIPAANWQEREIQDFFGLKLLGHPNPRRCFLHDDWPAVYPLRKDFDLKSVLPAFSGERHLFREVEGEGVFQVPVGPVHAGIIEPGHFLFSVAGEPVLYLQIRLAYTHKGTEKLFENLPIEHGVRLAESISGDSSVGHAMAFCHAIERAAAIEAPSRARYIRTVALELERLYNHIADIGAIATDVAFVVANAHAMRLKERVLRWNEELSGNRLLRGLACLGGVRFDWTSDQVQMLSTSLRELRLEFEALVQLIQSSSSTRDRLEATGILLPKVATDLGVVGIAGRASGVDRDLRRDYPHLAYDRVSFCVPVYSAGDVLHRMQVRIDEVFQSFSIIHQLLESMPGGPIRSPIESVPENATALGYVEGWRGEIFHWVQTAGGNRLARCKVKDPSLQNWPALSEAIQGNIIPDFPVVNKSFNLSYSGNDR